MPSYRLILHPSPIGRGCAVKMAHIVQVRTKEELGEKRDELLKLSNEERFLFIMSIFSSLLPSAESLHDSSVSFSIKDKGKGGQLLHCARADMRNSPKQRTEPN